MCKTSSSEDILSTSSGHLQKIFLADVQNIIIGKHPQHIFWTSAEDLPCRCAKHHHRKTSSAHLLDIFQQILKTILRTSSQGIIKSDQNPSSEDLLRRSFADPQKHLLKMFSRCCVLLGYTLLVKFRASEREQNWLKVLNRTTAQVFDGRHFVFYSFHHAPATRYFVYLFSIIKKSRYFFLTTSN